MDIRNNVKNLQEYIDEDEVYQVYKNLGSDGLDGDFDMYCAKHCEDIDNLIKEYKKVKLEKEALFEALIAVKEKKNRDKLVYRKKAKLYRSLVKKSIESIEEELEYCNSTEENKSSVYFLERLLGKLKGE